MKASAIAALLVLFAALAVCVAVLAVLGGRTGRGVDASDMPNASAHRHFGQTPSGLVEVGPRACDDPAALDAFNQFHANAHVHVAGSQGHLTGIVARACELAR